MTPKLTVNLLRVLYLVFVLWIGYMIGLEFKSIQISLVASAILGLLVILADKLLRGVSLRIFSAATFGLLMGLVVASLIKASGILENVSDPVQWSVSLVLYMVFGYLGMMLAIRSNRDEFSIIIPYVRFRREGVQDQPLVIDSSIIVDGRLPDICAAGFLGHEIIVPRFVITELEELSESPEPYERLRGQRGLENLRAMRQNPRLLIAIHESPAEPPYAVPRRLLQLASILQARVLTLSSDLARDAALHQVHALNLRDLANALHTKVLPGDQIRLHLTRPGREPHQAAGYLDDGTMIVLNNAHRFLGETVEAAVTGVTRTPHGQLYFGEITRQFLENHEAPPPPAAKSDT